MELEKAKKIADNLCCKLQPFCKITDIAGSVRRCKDEVKDIEICCLPIMMHSDSADLFGNNTSELAVSPDFVNAVFSLGKIEKGKIDGKYFKILLPEGIYLDLFIPDPHDYYRQFAIRTGPADYSAKVIAGGWRKKGWCGSDKGLRKMEDCIETKTPDGKSKWKCVNPKAEKPPIWKDERDFFQWIGVEWIEPRLRNI